ncbi:MAG: stage II sporulation protein E [Desulfuromonadales bacterium]|nr:MAG: stage II sporulation protein E [Desulfuromonadales bacterium]
MTECCGTSVPVLRDIAVPVAGISPSVTVREVVGIFQGDATLLTLPVFDNGQFLGIINRKVLIFKHLGRPFTMELFGKKPIKVLLDEHPLAMNASIDINSALERLIEADPTLKTDSFPVIEETSCIGIASVAELMMSISRTQAELLQTLNCLTARIRAEVENARNIQQDLLPVDSDRFGHIAVTAGMTTSTEIGGDFYDYIRLPDSTVCIVMGDVSGHGIQAGMVTTAAKASLHTLIAAGATTPARLLSGMNNAILATAHQNLLMTCVVISIDQQQRTATIANAGHTFPYLSRTSPPCLERIEEVSGFPLGLESDGVYTERTISFREGDRLIVYTDGIVEATDRTGSQFGYERFEAILQEHGEGAADLLKRKLFAAIHAYSASDTLDDDVAILIASFDTSSQEMT